MRIEQAQQVIDGGGEVVLALGQTAERTGVDPIRGRCRGA